MYDGIVESLKDKYFAPISRSGEMSLDDAVLVVGGASPNRLGNLPKIGLRGEKEYVGKQLFAYVRRLGDVKSNRRFGYLCISDLTRYAKVAKEEIDAHFPQEWTNRLQKDDDDLPLDAEL